MRTAFLFSIHHLAVIKGLINNYIDLRMSAIEMADTAESHKVVLVRDRKNNRTLESKVSLEDYGFATQPEFNWRVHSSGYVVCSIKQQNYFLHRMLMGEPSTHVNGDRLDNRRCNLVPTKPKVGQEDFELRGPRVIDIAMHTYKSTDKDLKLVNGYAVVHYENNKTYSGEVKKGVPHGFGILNVEDGTISYDLIGKWKKGLADCGMQINYKPTASCMCDRVHLCPLRQVIDVELIASGFKMRPPPEKGQGGLH